MLVLALAAVGCGDNNQMAADAGDLAAPADDLSKPEDGGAPTDGPILAGLDADNVAPMVVDNGPPAAGGSVDVPFVSVTLCVPGTSTCQTIDHISVDTGSTGLRIVASALTLTLPSTMAPGAKPMAECFAFADGFTWGAVRQADVKIGGELAANIPLQVIGDPAFPTVPTGCSQDGMAENTIADFGANGLLGIGQAIDDCGSYCATAEPDGYFSCTGTVCTAIGVAEASQIPNPIKAFASDNNGAILEFPAIDPGGAPTVSGVLVFGIGTRANNGLGSATVLTTDADGNFSTVYKGKTMPTSFTDSGTNSLAFDDSSIATCSGQNAGFFCPDSTLLLTATNTGLNNVSAATGFTVVSADTLFSTPNSAFNSLASPGLDANTFDWGFPFFLGRAVYVALDGATTPGGPGPYVAY
jgi:hypothetical protein